MSAKGLPVDDCAKHGARALRLIAATRPIADPYEFEEDEDDHGAARVTFVIHGDGYEIAWGRRKARGATLDLAFDAGEVSLRQVAANAVAHQGAELDAAMKRQHAVEQALSEQALQ